MTLTTSIPSVDESLELMSAPREPQKSKMLNLKKYRFVESKVQMETFQDGLTKLVSNARVSPLLTSPSILPPTQTPSPSHAGGRHICSHTSGTCLCALPHLLDAHTHTHTHTHTPTSDLAFERNRGKGKRRRWWRRW
jgi:hypothetical protein